MDRYVNYILNYLIKKYENSKLSQDGSDLNINISMKFDNKNMPDYVSEDSYKYEELIEKAVSYLENKNFIKVIKSKKRIDKVSLNLEVVLDIYKYLGLETREEKEVLYNDVFNKYISSNLVAIFYELMNNKFKTYKTYKSYFKGIYELEEILIILSNLEKQEKEISKRAFSSKYLGNSKRLEQLESKIVKIIKECLNLIDNNDEDILMRFNVIKNPTFIYIKGKGKFKINDCVIDLEKLESELILSSNHLNILEILSLNTKKVITIENLTSFYDYKETNSLVIYLGGFHNQIRKEFLLKVKEFKKDLEFYHLGDIDAGGFYILNHLITDTGINFRTSKMDILTLNLYKDSCNQLTKEDRKRLNDLKSIETLKDYYEVFAYMLDNNIKLEQENINYNKS